MKPPREQPQPSAFAVDVEPEVVHIHAPVSSAKKREGGFLVKNAGAAAANFKVRLPNTQIAKDVGVKPVAGFLASGESVKVKVSIKPGFNDLLLKVSVLASTTEKAASNSSQAAPPTIKRTVMVRLEENYSKATEKERERVDALIFKIPAPPPAPDPDAERRRRGRKIQRQIQRLRQPEVARSFVTDDPSDPERPPTPAALDEFPEEWRAFKAKCRAKKDEREKMKEAARQEKLEEKERKEFLKEHATTLVIILITHSHRYAYIHYLSTSFI